MSSKQWTEARALVENKLLKKRLEAAERENHELKHSLYQLSIRLTSALAEGSRTSHARTDGGTQDLDGSFKGDKILAAAAAAHVDGTDHVTIPEVRVASGGLLLDALCPPTSLHRAFT
eukprot:811585-Pleurochrysis_carterae.AAC.1